MQVPVELAFHGIDSSDVIRDYVEERIERLERIFDDIVSCRVVVEVPHRDSEDHIRTARVRAELSVPGKTLIGEAHPGSEDQSSGDPYQAIDMAFDRVQRQLRTWVDKIQEHSQKRFPTEANGLVTSLNRLEQTGYVELTDGREVYFAEPSLREVAFDDLMRGAEVKVVVGSAPASPYPVARKVRAA